MGCRTFTASALTLDFLHLTNPQGMLQCFTMYKLFLYIIL
jgi:hypothetical protein